MSATRGIGTGTGPAVTSGIGSHPSAGAGASPSPTVSSFRGIEEAYASTVWRGFKRPPANLRRAAMRGYRERLRNARRAGFGGPRGTTPIERIGS